MDNQELKDYVDGKFSDLERNLADRNKLIEKALDRADEIMKVRLDVLNNAKEQLAEQSQTFVTKEVCTSFHVRINDNLQELFKTVNRMIGVGIVIQMIFAAALVWVVAYLK